MTITNESNLSNNHKSSSQVQPDKVMKNKQQQTHQETVSKGAIETLSPQEIDSPQESKTSESVIKRFANWWETTTVERYLEDVADLLKESAILDILGLAANFALILSLFGWWTGREEQRENKLFATWAVINDAEEDQSGVVRTALERLHKEGFSLQGLELESTNLKNVDLQDANLKNANLQGADLEGANLQGADLGGANLKDAILYRANLGGVDFYHADLSDATVTGTNLEGANLKSARLYSANLRGSNLSSACSWEKAVYKVSSDDTTEKLIVDEEANQKYIEELKRDKSSDPKQQPDCSKWK